MRNKAILFCSILMASSSVLAEQSLLDSMAKQAAKDTVSAVAPDAVEKAEAANRALENAKNLKESAGSASDLLKDQAKDAAKEAVKQKITEATPEEAKKAVETAQELKEKVDSAPKTTEAIKGKVKEKAAEKMLDMMY